MTEPNKPSVISTNTIELINRYQEMLARQITAAFEHGQMDGEAYKRFAAIECEANTLAEVYDHFERVFQELTEYHRQKLRERIHKGAEILDSMGKDHPKYQQYMTLYHALCEELRRSEEGRERLGNHSEGGRPAAS